jgi:hypothetical protein
MQSSNIERRINIPIGMRRDMRILKDQRNTATNSQDDIELRRALRTTKSYNYEATTNDQHTEKH